jgi:hypothetical protein
MKTPLTPSRWAYLVLCLSVLSGCGLGDELGLASVKGTVKLDGEPLSDARVIFYPVDGGRLSSATTDLDGNYELVYVDNQTGALPGKHKVYISTFVEADSDSDDPLTKTGQRESIPAKYNAQTKLSAELEANGRETVDFGLQSS